MGLDVRKPVFRTGVSKQQRRRPACPSAQSDWHLYYTLIEKYYIQTLYNRNVNFRASLKAEHADLNLILAETLKTGFLASRSKYKRQHIGFWNLSEQVDWLQSLKQTFFMNVPYHIRYFDGSVLKQSHQSKTS